ncbi:lanthionine synthetase C family protein [Piscinibacter sp.]|uniref:lanthionine synthetase C family protein n=1 Tax=Piscinibacter sp. TaxID=1903157 RepID=UPI002C17DA8A|nr:LanC-like protein [Albitalea sp.]HUG25703.1 LanC-like protein [Albitalea sp.]
MLYDPLRHEPCAATPWSEARARAAIEHIVRDTEARFSSQRHWPIHPHDADQGETALLHAFYPLYFGACGVFWALHYLQSVGAVQLSQSYAPHVDALEPLNRAWLGSESSEQFASYLMGDTGILLLSQWLSPRPDTADRLESAIAGNIDNPTRELMWGSPGTMLAALFLHERDGEDRWADLFRRSAQRLRSQLVWSDEHRCHYWTQDMYGAHSSYLDAVHGFVATASVLIRGRHLLDGDEWSAWQACIENTVRRSATLDDGVVNWRAWLNTPASASPRLLVQFCHGAPGFVTCLAGLPGTALDDLLLAAGVTTWRAGPLKKGSNLCHGTGGNGYAFLALHRRTQDPMWLERARAFAMHGIEQTQADAAEHGRLRYSLWTGDPGFAVYLWDCIRGAGEFPTLDVFFPRAG